MLSTIFGSCLVTINLIDPISVSQGVTIGAPTMVFIINTASAVGRIGVELLSIGLMYVMSCVCCRRWVHYFEV